MAWTAACIELGVGADLRMAGAQLARAARDLTDGADFLLGAITVLSS